MLASLTDCPRPMHLGTVIACLTLDLRSSGSSVCPHDTDQYSLCSEQNSITQHRSMCTRSVNGISMYFIYIPLQYLKFAPLAIYLSCIISFEIVKFQHIVYIVPLGHYKFNYVLPFYTCYHYQSWPFS